MPDPLEEDPQVDNNHPEEQEHPSTEPETPDYQFILEELPESLRTVVQPHLDKYANDQRAKYEELESKYNPWNEVVDQYELEDAQKALNFARNFNESPLDSYRAIETFLKEQGLLEAEEPAPGNTPAQFVSPDLDDDDDEDDDEGDWDNPDSVKLKRYFDQQMEQVLNVTSQMAEQIKAQQEQEQQAKQQQQLNTYLDNLESKYGDLDRDYITYQLMQGADGEAAAKAYRQRIESQVQNLNAPSAEAPPVVGGGSALPSNKVSPGELSSKDTQDLVVSILNKAQTEGS